MYAVCRTLADISIGEKCRVAKLTAPDSDRRRMIDLGIVPDTTIEAVLKSPSGGITAYLIRGTVIAIRREDAENIFIK